MCHLDLTHIHAHCEHSELDGLAKIRELFTVAKSLGQDSLAITDHGTTSGLWEAQCVADELGMKAILGIEFYYEREIDGKNGHLLVLAKNNEGLRNIFKMQKYAARHNFYRKPRINFDILKEHSEGLIVTTACLGSTFNQYLMKGEYNLAKEWAIKFKEVFKDDFYIEIQPNQIPEQFITNRDSIKIARELDIKIVASNDVHYTYEEDCFPHEVLLALQFNKKMDDEKRFKFSTNDFWLKSGKEMYETFEGIDKDVVVEAINNTREISNKCNARIEQGNYLPKFYDTQGLTERELLENLSAQGIANRGLDSDTDYIKQSKDEIDVIDRNGYSGYFLIVHDFVTSAKRRNELVGDGRGSGAGSKVAYNIGITEIPPHEYDLLFERFMADGRQPDFDVDFSDQQSVFSDLQKKYGHENVSRIIAYGRMKPKAVVRKVLNAFNHSTTLINQISKLIPPLIDTLEEAYKVSPELLNFKRKYRMEWDVIERLEGIISHTSQHAGGVIIYQGLGEHVPLKYDRDNDIYVAEWDKVMLEQLGHYKFDVLGLETLPILHNTIVNIEKDLGKKIDLYKIDYEDKNVYNMLSKGDVSGIFQLSNQAAKTIEQSPRNFRDLIAINAMIRPGVGDWKEYIDRRKGKAWTTLPARMPYLEETCGTITYQEQFLLDCKALAGWDIAYSDKHVRKNKAIRTDEKLKRKFLQDSICNGYTHEQAKSVWDEIVDAVDGGYSFNKSHSASYARMSYQTAWLKYYYPLHFYAALMSSEKTDGDGQEQIAGYIAELKQRGIKIIPPDINHSNEMFNVVGDKIAYRITTIKHVGESAIKHINELRPISSFQDFLERRNTAHAKRNVVTNLIKAGAFDFDNPNRGELLWQFDMSLRSKTQIKNEVQLPKYEYNDIIKAEWEKEVLGMYLSTHPMEAYSFKPITEYQDGDSALQGGELYDIRIFNDKNGNEMAFAWLNTLHGNVKVVIFQRDWAILNNKELFNEMGNILLVRGKRSGTDILFNSGEKLK